MKIWQVRNPVEEGHLAAIDGIRHGCQVQANGVYVHNDASRLTFRRDEKIRSILFRTYGRDCVRVFACLAGRNSGLILASRVFLCIVIFSCAFY